MAESSASSIFAGGESHLGNCANVGEEVLESLLLGVETDVSAEDSVGLSCGASLATCLCTRLALTGEVNPDLSSIKSGLVGLGLSLSGILWVGVLDEGNTGRSSLLHDKLALGELSELFEVSTEAVLVGVVVKALDEKFKGTIIGGSLGSGVRSGALGDWLTRVAAVRLWVVSLWGLAPVGLRIGNDLLAVSLGVLSLLAGSSGVSSCALVSATVVL